MPKKILKIIAVLLPVLIPLLLVTHIVVQRHNADIYQFKIIGYDPRDMLYGHYLRYRFDGADFKAQSFPEDLVSKAKKLAGRYYIPEREARHLEDILLKRNADMRIGVGVVNDEKVFIEKLYINKQPMEKYLKERE